ncbi:MAG: SufS family cysteine desulfurase [Planctomycetota bacterium]|jgi:cysteine desulfurase/selenocysteine lyase
MKTSVATAFDVEAVRADFPILKRLIVCKPLIYLDNAATSQKPQSVIDALSHYYEDYNANIHRGVHHLSVQATEAYEEARGKLQAFVNAPSESEIVFLRGTTEAVNLVAQSFVRPRVEPGDEILITHLEHHSNIVPWQLVCEQTGAVLKVAPVDDDGDVIFEELDALLGERTRIVAIGHISNAFGTVNPVKRVVELAHARGVPVLIDGAQAAPHTRIDVQDLGCDFYAVSGHKMFGPTGIGALYARSEHLEAMPPYQGGGEMITKVSFSGTTWNVAPNKFEAGTPNIAGAIGLGAAVDYLNGLDWDAVTAHEADLLAYATEALSEVSGLRILGTARRKAAVISFVLDRAHPHDIGTILDQEGVAIRAGHHCAQPLMERFGVPATARASFALYNTRDEVDTLVRGLELVRRLFH